MCINTQFFYKLWISDVDPPSVTMGSIYKMTSLQKVHYFFIWTRCGWKFSNNWINFKVQMHHTLIVQNVEEWTWRHFRSYTDCVPSLFSIENAQPFLRYAIVVPYFWLWFSKTYSAWYYITTGRHTYSFRSPVWRSRSLWLINKPLLLV